MMHDIAEDVFQLSKLKTSFLPGELVTTGHKGTALFSEPDESLTGWMHHVNDRSIMIVVTQQGAMILVATSEDIGWTLVSWVDLL